MQSNKHSTSSSGNKRSSSNDDNQNSDSFAIQTNNIQLLLCGDLNSLPNSGVVQYLLDGKISTHHKDFKNLSYKNTLTKMLSHSPNQEFYTHAFKVILQAKNVILNNVITLPSSTSEYQKYLTLSFYDSWHPQ